MHTITNQLFNYFKYYPAAQRSIKSTVFEGETETERDRLLIITNYSIHVIIVM